MTSRFLRIYETGSSASLDRFMPRSAETVAFDLPGKDDPPCPGLRRTDCHNRHRLGLSPQVSLVVKSLDPSLRPVCYSQRAIHRHHHQVIGGMGSC